MKFWIYLERELSELLPEFKKIFGVNNLYYDYENVWEWIESKNENSKYYLNISRSHDWNKGDYDKPIMIKIKSNSNKKLNEEEIAKMIKEKFRCDVFVGEILVESSDNILIKNSKKY